MTARRKSPEGPLQGVRVLDFSAGLPGQTATSTLARLGADVIMVERPDGRAPYRELLLHRAINADKRSIALDLKSPDDASVARRLVRQCDVLVEGFRPRVMSRLGFGFRQCADLNPTITYSSISGFGQGHPRAEEVAHDLSILASTGILSLNRNVDGSLVQRTHPVRIVDLVASVFAVVGIVAALTRPKPERQAVHLDVSLEDVGYCCGMLDLAEVVWGGAEAEVSLLSDLPSYRLYETADGRALALAITAGDDDAWHRFARIVERDDWVQLSIRELSDPRRGVERDLGVLFGRHDLEWWKRALEGSAIPWSPVVAMTEVAREETTMRRILPTSGALAFPTGFPPFSKGLAAREMPDLDREGILADLEALESLGSPPPGEPVVTPVRPGHMDAWLR